MSLRQFIANDIEKTRTRYSPEKIKRNVKKTGEIAYCFTVTSVLVFVLAFIYLSPTMVLMTGSITGPFEILGILLSPEFWQHDRDKSPTLPPTG